MSVETIELDEFHARLKAQGVADRLDLAFRCPMCTTVQSMRTLIAAEAGATAAEVERFVGFACVGRWTGAGSPDPKQPAGQGCNWTLGGLFQTHRLQVVTDEGLRPTFEVATAEEASELAARAGQLAEVPAHG